MVLRVKVDGLRVTANVRPGRGAARKVIDRLAMANARKAIVLVGQTPSNSVSTWSLRIQNSRRHSFVVGCFLFKRPD